MGLDKIGRRQERAWIRMGLYKNEPWQEWAWTRMGLDKNESGKERHAPSNKFESRKRRRMIVVDQTFPKQ